MEVSHLLAYWMCAGEGSALFNLRLYMKVFVYADVLRGATMLEIQYFIPMRKWSAVVLFGLNLLDFDVGFMMVGV